MPPKLEGVLETCLYVQDMERASAFYEEILGLSPVVEEERITVYEIAAGSVLILFLRGATLEPVKLAGGVIPPHDGNGPLHYALAISADSLPDWRRHLEAADVAIESEVRWPRGGTSLYFRDPDRHLIELATPGLWPRY